MEKFIYVNGEFIDRISDDDLGRIEKCFNGKIVGVKERKIFDDLALEIYLERKE